MELDSDGIICVLFLLPIFTQFILWSAVCHIHDLGKSKTSRKKSRQNFSLIKKVLLVGYVEDCKYYADRANKLRFFYWVGIVYLTFSILCWILSSFIPQVTFVLQGLVSIKVILFDVPVFIFFFLMTKHGKNGGVTWKWEAPH